jgi:hypothetical protein
VIGGDRAGELTGRDERTDGRARVVSGRATREGKSAADEWGRPVSEEEARRQRGRAHGKWVAWAGQGAWHAGKRREGWARFDPTEGGDFLLFFLFLFLFLLSPLSFEQIFSYIFLGVKNILCEVLLTIMVCGKGT